MFTMVGRFNEAYEIAMCAMHTGAPDAVQCGEGTSLGDWYAMLDMGGEL